MQPRNQVPDHADPTTPTRLSYEWIIQIIQSWVIKWDINELSDV